MPHSAVYPYLLATTTAASRAHAIERWHLPHHMRDVSMSMHAAGDQRMTVTAREGDQPIVELVITSHGWRPAAQLHQSFMCDTEGDFLAEIAMQGEMSESEEEAGRLTLFPHPMTAPLGDLEEVSTVPLREMWMRDGVQTFQPLRLLAPRMAQ